MDYPIISHNSIYYNSINKPNIIQQEELSNILEKQSNILEHNIISQKIKKQTNISNLIHNAAIIFSLICIILIIICYTLIQKYLFIF